MKAITITIAVRKVLFWLFEQGLARIIAEAGRHATLVDHLLGGTNRPYSASSRFAQGLVSPFTGLALVRRGTYRVLQVYTIDYANFEHKYRLNNLVGLRVPPLILACCPQKSPAKISLVFAIISGFLSGHTRYNLMASGIFRSSTNCVG